MVRWVAVVLVGCGFQPATVTATGDDASATGSGDARPIDARPIDAARVCPPPPTGCSAFACSGSGSCYYLCAKRSWTAAASACGMQHIGCIVTINDQAEQDCIVAASNPVFPDVVWFGFVQAPNSVEPAGGWGWQCGSSTYVAPNWGSGEPNNQGGHEDCAAMTTGGGWFDADCTTQARYVCEL